MHKTVIYNTGETIRFRRWSGKGYAIFRSLHRHVTIGRVCKSIADSALSKDKNTMNLGGGGSDTRTQKEEEAQPPEGSPELLSILSGVRIICGHEADEYPGSPCHVFSFICHPYKRSDEENPWASVWMWWGSFVTPLFLYLFIMIEELEKKVHEGQALTPEEVLRMVEKTPLDALCEAAHRITLKYASRKFDLCSIINAKSGRCSENCKWCAQSAHHPTGIETYGIVPKEECLRHARINEQSGIRRFSLVASGKRPTDQEVDTWCGHLAYLRETTGLSLCVSLGLASEEQLRKLRQAGASRYHCNLETAPSYFARLCTTHTQAEKIETLRAARRVGMEVCSGGIIGMGENMRQRAELAFTLKALEIPSIPLNLLHPIKGTPLEAIPPLSEEEILRTIALFRFANPSAYLRFAGGRSQLSDETVRRAMYTGINSAIAGDLLTTIGSNVEEDVKRIKETGYEL